MNTEQISSALPASTRVTQQVRQFERRWFDGNDSMLLEVRVRYDDECENGHNTFAITSRLRRNGRWESGGCQHDLVAQHVQELAPYIRWHLTSSDGPLHYVQNVLYWLGWNGWCRGENDRDPPNLQSARRAAVWPELPEDWVCPPQWRNTEEWRVHPDLPDRAQRRGLIRRALEERLPALMLDFKRDVESLGFRY